MKKLKIVLILILVISISACVSNDDDAEDLLIQSASTELIDGIRKFPSVTDYEEVLDLKNLPEISGFVSFADVVNDPKNTKSNVARIWQEDDFLRDFLTRIF